jgi:hypothetical protein
MAETGTPSQLPWPLSLAAEAIDADTVRAFVYAASRERAAAPGAARRPMHDAPAIDRRNHKKPGSILDY